MRTDRENQGPQRTRTFQPNPKSLYLILSVVFFERVAAGVLLSLIALYLREHRGLAPSAVFFVVGAMMAGSYVLSMPAGVIADGHLGHQRTALLSLGLLIVGQTALLSDQAALLWTALSLIAIGLAFYRVTIPTLLGRLYEPTDPRRDSAFSHFYSALNLGYLVGPLGGEWVRARYGWPPVFAIAVGALLFALLLLIAGYRRIERETAHRDTTAAIELGDFSQRERAIYLLCGLAIVFWLAMQQSSTSLTFFAEESTTQRLIFAQHTLALHPGYFAGLHGFMVLMFTATGLGALKRWRLRGDGPSVPVALAFGLLFAATAFAVMSAACLYGAVPRASLLWLGGAYLFLSIGEVLYSALGLSVVMQLAPRRRAGRMNGLWFAAVAAGNLAAGLLGALWTRLPHHRYFALIAALLFIAALGLLLRSNTLEEALERQRRDAR